jgi:glutamyl/glutaminyl-tRNA synthetase
MTLNFGQARLAKAQGVGGETIMRFDDTNPTAEKQEYIDSILKNVQWLGNQPVRVTFSSDYFEQLYEFAVELIKQGDVYVCHQTKEQVKHSRDVIRDAHINHLPEVQCPHQPPPTSTTSQRSPPPPSLLPPSGLVCVGMARGGAAAEEATGG